MTAYPDKIANKPITFTAPQELHDKLDAAAKRQRLTRSDTMCRLIDRFARQL